MDSKKKDIVVGGKYRHYKGDDYTVLGIVRHSETLQELVHYECHYENELGQQWVRPLEMFIGNVEIEGKSVPRFALVQDE